MMRTRTLSFTTLGLAACAALLLAGEVAAQNPWSYHDPGDLIPGSGSGRVDWEVYAPGMRFPIENGPAYPNSQVWGNGGGSGPGGSQCDTVNYDYPWRDNYCESRSWTMPLCPTGQGHQGQDIRPATCEKSVHWTVAAEAGTVTNIGSYSVYVTTPGGTRHDYLHGDNVSVSSGQSLTRGQRINRVSNEFGGTPTTYHLHYNLRQDVAGVGTVYVPPYMSLIQSYEDLMGFGNVAPTGALLENGCEAIRGWAWDEDTPAAAINVRVAFDGAVGDPSATVVELVADQYEASICGALGSCEHAFVLDVPLSLRDGQTHSVRVYAEDDDGGGFVELVDQAGDFSCSPPALPGGERRLLSGPEAVAAWSLSPFWDMAIVDDPTLQMYPQGPMWLDAPVLVQSDLDPATTWLIDGGYRRAVSDLAATNWELDLGTVMIWPDASVVGVPQGPALRDAPLMISTDGLSIYVVDAMICPLDDPECDDDTGMSDTGEAGSGGEAGEGEVGSDGSSVTDSVTGSETGAEGLDVNGDDDKGCACNGTGGGRQAGVLLLLGLLGLRRRRPPGRK